MNYKKARNVLPDTLIDMIQEYIDGEYLYIPRKNRNVRKWGETSGSRGAVSKRNKQIFLEYGSGLAVAKLSHKYFLSERTILNIISKEKRK